VRQIEGQVMETRQTSTAPRNKARRDAAPSEWQIAAASLPLLALLIAWRQKRRRAAPPGRSRSRR
jgi:hypothetical protein